MKRQRTSRPRRKAPCQRPDAQMRPAPQTPPPGGPQTNPADNPPPKRELKGWVYEPDAEGNVRGTLLKFRARYAPLGESVHIELEHEDHSLIWVFADHTMTRAAISSLRNLLDAFDRLAWDDSGVACAGIPNRTQVECIHDEGMPFADGALRFRHWLNRAGVCFGAQFHDIFNGWRYSLKVWLTRTEAEALLHDLERALGDMERFGDV